MSDDTGQEGQFSQNNLEDCSESKRDIWIAEAYSYLKTKGLVQDGAMKVAKRLWGNGTENSWPQHTALEYYNAWCKQVDQFLIAKYNLTGTQATYTRDAIWPLHGDKDPHVAVEGKPLGGPMAADNGPSTDKLVEVLKDFKCFVDVVGYHGYPAGWNKLKSDHGEVLDWLETQ